MNIKNSAASERGKKARWRQINYILNVTIFRRWQEKSKDRALACVSTPQQMETGKGFAPPGVNEVPEERRKWHEVQKEAVGGGEESAVSVLIAHETVAQHY